MAEVAHDAQDGFWRPPEVVPSAAASPALAETCSGCGTEFMIASHYCHVCGTARQALSASVSRPSWTRYLEFPHIKQALGLPLPSLVAFIVGIACLVGAISVGAIYAVQNFADFQAIQLWRMEWLLGAVAAFLAAIVLKRNGPEHK